MKKYQVFMTGILSLILVFGFTLTACKNDSGDEGGGILGKISGGRGGNNSGALTAPGSIYAVPSSSSITVSWSLVSGASGYKISRANAEFGSYVSQGETGDASYTDTTVSPNTPYYYKVKAYNNAGDGPESSAASALITGSTGSGTSLPAAPTGVTATRRSEDEVYVTWTPVNGVTTYLVYWAEEAAGPYALDGTSNTPSHLSKEWADYDYGFFKVSSVNATGEGPQSGYARFGAYTSGGTSSVPSAPSGVSASASSSSSITVTWTEVTGATGYRVYRAEDDDGFSYRADTSSTSYLDTTGLFQGRDYAYKIAAYNSYGEGPQSSPSIAIQTIVSTPSVPSGVFASANSSSSITVQWSEVPGAEMYYVYRSTSLSSNYSFSQINTVEKPNTSYTDTGLSLGTTYYYKVSAYNSAGESSQSTYTSATTWSSASGSSAPAAPTGVWAYQISSGTVYVSWNSVSDATQYNVYWALSSSGPWHLEDGMPTTGTSFYSPDWGSSGQAYFKVTAVNTAGYESEYSSVYSVSLSGSSYSVGTVPEAQKKQGMQ